MGASVSSAKADSAEAEADLNALISILENKLEAFQLEVESKRGLTTENTKEVVGGRTISRISDITVSTGAGVDGEIEKSVKNFFKAASNAIDDDSLAAKQSAIDGAKSLVIAGLDAIFGASNGQGKTKKSFIVLFLNNAFVRIDYYVYAYSVKGKVFGAEANKSGCCYLTDLAVLDISQMTPQEIDFLLSQALKISANELDNLNELKIHLIQSSILGRALADENLEFEKLSKLTQEYSKSQKKITEVFDEFDNHTKTPTPTPTPTPPIKEDD